MESPDGARAATGVEVLLMKALPAPSDKPRKGVTDGSVERPTLARKRRRAGDSGLIPSIVIPSLHSMVTPYRRIIE